MVRPRLSLCLMTIAALFCATPAFAQFGSIFRDDPPRPPADVPGAPPSNIPSPDNFPSRSDPRPPADQPPAQPLPAPMSLPPSSRPGAGAIESQPLAPLPGGPVAPQPAPQ
jgi:hypothetical protein